MMTVYVDNMRRPARVGRIQARWSHLFADTHEGLLAAAADLGLRPEWIQHEGTHREHFDVTDTKRQEAIARGAVQITYPSGTGALLETRRETCACDRCKRMRDQGFLEPVAPPPDGP